MKYYVLGALASGFLLYGISMLYGATGSLELNEVLKAVASGHINDAVLLFGVIFVVAGVAFKMGAVPFHMWVPDVYQGAPTAMTLLTGGGPKVAAFAWGLRFLVMGLLPLAVDWQEMLVILAALSLIVGNMTGIVQKNIKRMLAYSAISNMGFVLLGLLAGVVDGKLTGAASAYSSAMFYSIVYLVTTLGTFGVVMLLARRDFEAETLDDFKGLNQRSPVFAFVMMVMMFSLAGIPPTVGFYAKLAVLEATMNAGLTWLAVLAVITSLFGAFYYLRIVKLMYFDAPQDASPIVADGLNRAPARVQRRGRAGARHRSGSADVGLPARPLQHTLLVLMSAAGWFIVLLALVGANVAVPEPAPLRRRADSSCRQGRQESAEEERLDPHRRADRPVFCGGRARLHAGSARGQSLRTGLAVLCDHLQPVHRARVSRLHLSNISSNAADSASAVAAHSAQGARWLNIPLFPIRRRPHRKEGRKRHLASKASF